MGKRITLFIASLSSGGAEHQLIELAKMLAEKNYTVSIVTFSDLADHYSVPPEIERIRLSDGKSSLHKVLAITFFFLTTRTDVVISFCQRNNYLCLWPLLLRRKIKVIAGERNTTVGAPDRIEKILFSFLYNRANWIVPNSNTQASYITKNKPSLAQKVIPIINYTDIELYKPSDYTKHSITRIGVFCRYDPQKNYERFVKAIKTVKNKTEEVFIVEWYGSQFDKDGKENEHFLRMKSIVLNEKLCDTIILHNHVKDVQDILPSFDAIALPSLFEGFSNSISEALCCGLPMLVSDVSDNRLMVKDGENGYLFNPYMVEEIAEAFIKFLKLSYKQKKQMAISSRKIAEAIFNKEVFINSYIKLIEQ